MLRVVNFGSGNGGLATVGYTVYGVDGAIISTRSTASVVEIGTSTGIYAANIGVPDYDCIVLWDTGGASPVYSTEDYQQQINTIVDQTGQIQKIYNSIRNQGEFFSAFMDKLGLLEKNIGLEKVNNKIDTLVQRDNVSLTNIEEAFKSAASKINLTAIAPEVKIPNMDIPEINIPDYSPLIADLKNILLSVRGEIMKLPKAQKEYTGNFSNLVNMLNSLEQKINTTVSQKSSEIAGEVKDLKTAFVKFDALVNKMNEFNTKLNSLDVNDKDIMNAKKEISDEIKRLNNFINQISLSIMAEKNKGMSEMLLSFGHKR
jgi:methyl-accepting chemotaxis protein